MTPAEIKQLRTDLNLTQIEFGRLLDAHFMTVSKWEHDSATPSPYQLAMMDRFQQTAAQQKAEASKQIKNLLIGAGVVAAIAWLLTAR